MSFIRPFSAALVRPSWASQVLAPPHDSLSQEERRRIMASNEFSYLHVTRRVDGRGGEGASANRVALDRLVAAGAYRRWGPSSLYVYRLSANGHEQTGIVADVSIEAADAGLIRGHEAVRAERVEALLRHFQEVPARSDLVVLMHPEDRELDDVLERCCRRRPILSVSGDLGTHMVWRLDQPREIGLVQGKLRDQVLYVADGHHRIAAVRQLHELTDGAETPGVPSVILSEAELRVLSFYRRVLGPVDGKYILRRLSKVADVKVVPRPSRNQGSFGMYLAGSWHAVVRRGRNDTQGVSGLDVSYLHTEILEPVFSIRDPDDPRVETIPETASLQELTRRCDSDAGVGFLVAAPTIAQIRGVADRGEVLPPKATWFDPKPPSGLFLQLPDDPDFRGGLGADQGHA